MPLFGLDADFVQLVDDTHLRRHVGRGHGMTSIPQQVLVAVLDEIAAVNELNLQIAVRERVREALIDQDRRLRRDAIETRERHLRCGLRRRVETEQAGTEAGRK